MTKPTRLLPTRPFRRTLIVVLTAALVAFSIGSGPAAASAAGEPMTVTGTVPSAAGAAVNAHVGAVVCGSARIRLNAPTSFTVQVFSATQRTGCGTPGGDVRFTVAGQRMAPTVRFSPGGTIAVVLTPAAQPTPRPSATPAPTAAVTPSPTPAVTPSATPSVRREPMTVSGKAITDGAAASAGSVVRGHVGSVVCGTTTTSGADGAFNLSINSSGQQAGCGTAGSSVTYTVNGRGAIPGSSFLPGGTVTVTLSAGQASSVPPTATAPPATASPTTTPRATAAAATAAPATAPPAAGKRFGVTIAGGEFGEGRLPGSMHTDYTYATDPARFRYFAGKGQALIRIPFRWERVQPTASGSLSEPDIAELRKMLDSAQANNQQVILDLHNYARYYGTPLGRADAATFADVWSRLAREFRGHPALYGYELMNEPHDLPDGSDGWAFLAQAATDAIRREDRAAWILAPGYSWQTARFWPENNRTLDVRDPANRLLYAAHQYFDADHSGAYGGNYDAERASPSVGAERLQPFLDWLAARNARGIITEYGVPDMDARWLTVLDHFLGAMIASPRIVGGTYWAAGPWWGTYPLSVEPRNGQDRPQIAVLQRASNPAQPAPTSTPVTSTPTRTATPAAPTPAATRTSTPAPSTPTPPPATTDAMFGVLSPAARLGLGQMQAWKAAGGTHVEVIAFWDQLQFAADAPLDSNGLAAVQRQLDDAAAAGLQVVFTVALQYPPAFVQATVPKFRDQHGQEWTAGQASGDNVRDWVFTQVGRQYVSDYTAKVIRGLNLGAVETMRLGGGIRGELQFPPTGSYPYRFWGYSAAAQTGAGLAHGLDATPRPGHVPFGSGSPTADDAAWSAWYLESLKRFMLWQIQQYRSAGWQGNIHVLHPSWGMRSNWTGADRGYQEAVAQGQDWSRLIAAYADQPNVWPWCTWIDSRDTPYYPGPDSEKAPWRKLYDVAATYGKTARIRGENTGGQSNADMERVFREALAYGYQGLAWLSWSSLSTAGHDTLANLQRLIGAR